MTVVPRMPIWYGFFLSVKFHVALWFSAFTIVYLHQLTKRCLCSSWCTPHTFDNHTQRLVLPSFPLFGGERGFTLASHHTFRLCPLAFASVSRCFKALFTTQHRHRPVLYPATRHSTFYASYRSLWHVVDIPVREVRKRQSHGLSAQYQWSSVKRLPKKPCETWVLR